MSTPNVHGLTAIESACDYALMIARTMARYQEDARRHPIARGSCLYQVGRCRRRIVNAAIYVERALQREIEMNSPQRESGDGSAGSARPADPELSPATEAEIDSAVQMLGGVVLGCVILIVIGLAYALYQVLR